MLLWALSSFFLRITDPTTEIYCNDWEWSSKRVMRCWHTLGGGSLWRGSWRWVPNANQEMKTSRWKRTRKQRRPALQRSKKQSMPTSLAVFKIKSFSLSLEHICLSLCLWRRKVSSRSLSLLFLSLSGFLWQKYGDDEWRLPRQHSGDFSGGASVKAECCTR